MEENSESYSTLVAYWCRNWSLEKICDLFKFTGLFVFFFLPTPHGTLDLSSLARDGTHVLCRSGVLTTGRPGKSLRVLGLSWASVTSLKEYVPVKQSWVISRRASLPPPLISWCSAPELAWSPYWVCSITILAFACFSIIACLWIYLS